MSASKFSTDLEIAASKSPNGLVSLDILSSASFTVPGFRASIDRFGAGFEIALNFDADPDAAGEDLGLFSITPKYRPVTSLAAEIDLPPVSGGGYLELTGNELRGAFAASLGVISVNALTVMELDRFSLLVLMAAEFLPPLQLSFGFTLVGVGGIVGINRGVDDNALGDAMRNGDLSLLFFPRDPVSEAPRILDIADRCFPYRPGEVLVGPMIKVGWGTPTMLSATLAVIVSSSEARAILLGRLAVMLPAEAAPLFSLQALVKGDVDQWGVRIDATLINSRIMAMPVDGDISLRMITGPDEPLFAISAGGFYPGFAPPEGMGGMRRLSIDLSPNPIMTLRAEAYLAITTNSIQFGANVQLHIGVDGYGIHGQVRIDAFINYDPFCFEVSFQASVSIECADFDIASIRLNGTIGGPARWSLSGHATIEILFFDIDIDIPRIEWGAHQKLRIVGRDPLVVLRQAIAEQDNWVVATPEVSRIVRLRNDRAGTRLCHPLGGIAFKQNNIPLETEITLVDGISLEAPVTLHLARHGEAGSGTQLTEKFIPDRFFKLDDNQRLARSGYRDLPAGLDLSPPGVAIGPECSCSDDYEIKILEKAKLLPFLVLRPDFVGELIGPSLRQKIESVPPFVLRDPKLTITNPAFDLTDAAGRVLADIPQWELEMR
jgi:hypothetical protein